MENTALKETLLEALRAAGDIIYKALCDEKIIEFKGEIDIVTPTDKAAEKAVTDIIKKKFPDHAILAEESRPEGHSPYRWIIDPLDGTTNFAHGLPHAAVSIALTEKGTAILGGVLDPFRKELFFAEKGKGAFVNKARITVSKTKALDHAMLATGFPYDRREHADKYLALYKAFMVKTQGIRRLGSASLDLCYVACGRYDGFWELKLHPWDTAAGALIAEEAGGTVTNFRNEKFDIFGTQTLASNGLVHGEMLKVLEPFGECGM